jgi:hypothetical protein
MYLNCPLIPLQNSFFNLHQIINSNHKGKSHSYLLSYSQTHAAALINIMHAPVLVSLITRAPEFSKVKA